MTDTDDWAFPPALQPDGAQLPFDLQRALDAVVRIRAVIPEGAFTAPALGTERIGNGVLIEHAGQRVILTIGYLITEAQQLWLTTHDGREVPGHALAHDSVTGFGLVLPLGDLHIPTLPLGASQHLTTGAEVTVIGHGGIAHAISSKVIARREFAGYWEYLLDEALLVSPPHPQWGGTTLLDTTGKVAGIGSLLMQEHVSGDQFDANLFVPIELLLPLLDELLTKGKVQRPERPWLGLYVAEQDEQVVMIGVTASGPAQQAQLQRGDVITHVDDTPVTTLAGLYRTLWAQGPAGSMITLNIRRGKRSRSMQLRSASREDYLLKPRAH